MSDDRTKSTRFEASSDSSEKTLEHSPDARSARNADGDTLKSAQSQNQDIWRSKDGHFAITYGRGVLARQVNESRKARLDAVSETGRQLASEAKHNPALEPVALLRAYADTLPDGREKQNLVELSRSQGSDLSPAIRERLERSKEKISHAGLDEAGSFPILMPQETSNLQTDSEVIAFKPESYSPGQPTDSLAKSLGEAFVRAKPEVRQALIEALKECPAIMQQRPDVAVSSGIVKGVTNFTDGAIKLGGLVWETLEFTSDVITNNPRAEETSAKVKSDLCSGIVSGVKVFTIAELYLHNIHDSGDYQKPVRDVVWLKDQLDEKWNKMSEFQKQEFITECATDAGIGAIPLGQMVKFGKFTEALEGLGQFASKLDRKGQEAFAHAFRRMIDRLGPQVEVVDSTGKVVKVPAGSLEEYSLKMSKHEGEQFGKKRTPRLLDMEAVSEELTLLRRRPFGRIDKVEGCQIAEKLRAALHPRQGQNIAVSQVDLDGTIESYASLSGKAGPGGTLSAPPERLFQYTDRDGAMTRAFDSELKILENVGQKALRSKNGEKTVGAVNIFTERYPCDSCLNVIEQFERKFPNIKVKVTYADEPLKRQKGRLHAKNNG